MILIFKLDADRNKNMDLCDVIAGRTNLHFSPPSPLLGKSGAYAGAHSKATHSHHKPLLAF